jgi:hypothetical protein
VDIQAYLYASTAVNILTDGVIVVLPILPITRLRLPRRKKVAICLLFLVGGLSCASSVVRLVSLGTLKDLDISCEWFPSLSPSTLREADRRKVLGADKR